MKEIKLAQGKKIKSSHIKKVKRSFKKNPILTILVVLLVAFLSWQSLGKVDEAHLVRVVDGDTLVVLHDGEEKRLRLIGVDTPESVHPDASKNVKEGELASAYVKKLLVPGSKLYLEKDVSDTDRYGRLLRYVYLTETKDWDQMLNVILLREGYAQAVTFPPDVKYVDEFRALEKEARSNKKGLFQ